MVSNAKIVNADVQYLRDRSRENIHNYVTTTLPEQMENTLVGLNQLIHKLYQDIDNKDRSIKDKHNAISLIKDCYAMRLETLGAGALASDINKGRGNRGDYTIDEIKAISTTTS